MRIRKAYNPEKSAVSYAVCSISAVILVGLSAILSYEKVPQRKVADISKTEVPTTTTTMILSTKSTNEISTTSAVSTTSTQSTSSDETETLTSETVTSTETMESETETTSGETETTVIEEETEPEQNDEPEQEQPTEPIPEYIYNNGTYTGTAYGYAGDITVTITIENDVIIDIQAVADGDDPDYYDEAMYYILPQIQQTLSADVDAYAGATYSSQGIIDAARNALSQAVR